MRWGDEPRVLVRIAFRRFVNVVSTVVVALVRWIRSRASVVAAALLLIAGVGGAGAAAGSIRADSAASRPPNIVLIMADDVGYEAFGAYGSEQYETPQIDALAEEGMRFTRAFSQPVCTPSRIKIMSGKSNVRNYTAFGVMDPGVRTFAHMLKDRGYATATAGKWQLYGPDHYPEPTRRAGTLPGEAGFDAWALWQVRTRPGRYWEPTLEVNGELRSFGPETFGPDVATDFLIEFMEAHRDEPFLAYYPMMLPHAPFVPTPHSANREQRGDQRNFEDMVAYVDHLVGRIVERVDELGLAEETLIVFTGDNGTHTSLSSRLDGRSIRGGKSRAIASGMHVPLVARMPGTVPAASVDESLVGFADFVPTFADLAGFELPAHEVYDGRSFAPQLRGEPAPPRDGLFLYYWPRPISRPNFRRDTRFAYDHRFKLYGDGRLYELAEDPATAEPIPVGEGGPEVRRARRRLTRVLESMPTRPQALMVPDSLRHRGGRPVEADE